MLISGKSASMHSHYSDNQITKNLHAFFLFHQKVKRSNKLTLCIRRHVDLLSWIRDLLVFGWEECVGQHNVINIVHPGVIQQIWVKVEKHRHLHLAVKKNNIKSIKILLIRRLDGQWNNYQTHHHLSDIELVIFK